MKTIKKKIEWYALMYDTNTRNLIKRNVIRNDMIEDIKKYVRLGKITSINDLKEFITQELKYHYLSRTEYEIIINGLFSTNETAEKIDIWYQLEPNIDNIVELLILKLNLQDKLEYD